VLSVKTVQAHRTSLMQKLDLHDRGDLIKYAIQRELLTFNAGRSDRTSGILCILWRFQASCLGAASLLWMLLR